MKTAIYIFVIIVIIIKVATVDLDDADFNMAELTKKFGYPFEIHEIESEDGYLTDVFRIPYGRRSRTKKPNRSPVILNHGLMGSAENFILVGPKKALAYKLADNGYDVWLLNARGTFHSRKHKTLNPDNNTEFWQFTLNEIGIYELPASIDYILNITNTDKIHYIGHSQGTTTFFVMCSERPEYNEKIKLMVALAPSAILRNIKHPYVLMVVPIYRFLERLADEVQVYELPPFISPQNIRTLSRTLCGKNAIIPRSICHILIELIIGFTDDQIDKRSLPLLFNIGPGGASTKQALHYAQLIASGRFRKYDWGRKENLRRYHSEVPPDYNLKNVTAPIALLYGEADLLVTKEDVEILAKILPNVVELYKLPIKTWTHMDFLWAKNIDIILNNKIINLMNKYDNK